MILFKLRCDAEHEFEGWFKDGATYERQRARSQIACPDCSSTRIEKAPMAPRLGRGKAEPAPERPPSPGDIRRKLQELRKAVEANCEHVGENFAAEARAIHRGEAEARGIYGEATKAESEALADEGIEVAQIPWIPSSDA